jgi:tripeptidyl-peptidase-1
MSDDTPLRVHIAIAQSNISEAGSALLAISNPDSPHYGRHWTPSEVARAFAPAAEDVALVVEWLAISGIPSERLGRSHGADQLAFDSTVGELSRILSATYYHYTDVNGQEAQVACEAYRLPPSVASLIDYITPTLPHVSGGFAEQKRTRAQINTRNTARTRDVTSSLEPVDCRKYTAPSCLRDIYGIPIENRAPHPNNSFGLFQLAWVTWRPEDLDSFFSRFQPELVGRRPLVERIDGGYLQYDYNMTAFNLEANLDFQYAMALSGSQPIVDLQVGDKFRLGNINNMLAAFDKYYCAALDPSIDPVFPDPAPGGYNSSTDCGTVAPPNVISMSYSYNENDFPAEYLRRQCNEFLKLGLMGVTVVVASGDTGTKSGPTPGTCIDPTSDSPNATDSGRFSPQWPASCPWVTVVGGTQLTTQTTDTSSPPPAAPSSGSVNETAFRVAAGDSSLSSSGGFSDVFSTPAYQLGAVTEYKHRERHHLAALGGRFNGGGRGYPDVAALASTYLTVVDDKLTTVYGTSASAPVFASIISMINNERLHAGKGRVGFVNPTLYAHANVLRDIASGANEGCGVSEAFRASAGWDAVTGLGSPDYERMRRLFMSLP